MLLEKVLSWMSVLIVAIALDIALFRWRLTLAPQWAARAAGWLAPLRAWASASEAAANLTHTKMSLMSTNAESQASPEPPAPNEPAAPVPNVPAVPEPPPPSPAPEAAVSASPQIITTTSNDHMARVTVEVPIGATVRVTIETLPGGGTPVAHVSSVPLLQPEAVYRGARRAPQLRLTAALAPLAKLWGRVRAWWQARNISLEATLFGLALAVYLLTRLIGLEEFPVYFFTDEAIHTNMAADFIRRGLKNYEGDFLPVYFNLGLWLNGISVYVQVLPYLLFGKSIFVTRAASALVTALGAAAVGLTLRDVFKVRYWWAGALLLSIAPTWFFHSRTAFEYIELASFYAIFIYCYLRYRTDKPRFLYGAVVAGALVFYTHGLGQMLIGVTTLALLLSDLRYHFQQRRIVMSALGLAVLLALPYFRYISAHSDTYFVNLRQRDSYWTNLNLTLLDKLRRFSSEYLYGLSPQFWFFPNNRDLQRHLMKGYGHLLWPTLPFAVLGLLLVLRHIRSATHRAVLLTLLCTPIGSALIAIGVPRVLWFVVPATLITALGLSFSLEWLERWLQHRAPRLRPAALSVGLFVLLAGTNVYMLADGLINGPRWYTDYTLYGMQYGAKQVFGELIPALLKRDPQAQIFVSPSWANGTEQFVPFFFDTPQQQARVRIRTVDEFLFQRTELDPTNIFVMMPAEYERAITSQKFKPLRLDSTLYYPDGSTAFYVARLEYADNVEAVFAAEAAERRKPVEGQIMIDGQMVAARYSRLGGGDLIHMFDGDTFTLARGLEANPFVIELTFPEPRSVSGLAADFGSMDFALAVLLYPPDSEIAQPYAQTFTQNKPDPHVEMTFADAPAQISRLRLEVTHLNSGETAQIHIRELKFLP